MAATLEHLGSLITYQDGGADTCLGYLMDFSASGHGVYDASIGRVEVSAQDAETHNQLLDAAMLTGLDESCGIGQGSTFYLTKDANQRPRVTTFIGTEVADAAHTTVSGRSITFRRAGRVYSGRIQRDADCFNFRRIQ